MIEGLGFSKLSAVYSCIGISLFASGLLSNQAFAANQVSDHVMCAAYIDISVEDLYPLGAIPHNKAREMLVGRVSRMAAASLMTNKSAESIVADFIAVKSKARLELVRDSGLNGMGLYNQSQMLKYIKQLDIKVSRYCAPSNNKIKNFMLTHTKEEVALKMPEITAALQKYTKIAQNEEFGIDSESSRQADDTNNNYDDYEVDSASADAADQVTVDAPEYE